VDAVRHFGEDATVLTPRIFDDAELALAADVAAVGEVAGDGFEFRREPGRVRFAVFDAMGSDARSAELVGAVVAEYRQLLSDPTDQTNTSDLAATASRLDRLVVERCGRAAVDVYCTGVLAELNTVTGELRTFSAGHPSPLLLNLSTRQHRQLSSSANLPFGLSVLLDEAPAPGIDTDQLQPGQVVAVYTDGVTEARATNREFLGERQVAEALTQLLAGGLCPAEAVSQMMRFLNLFQNGSPRDDATLVLAQWRGQLPLDGDLRVGP
jgi:serine phosphatase RsbU (regulator of sigma subunit)